MSYPYETTIRRVDGDLGLTLPEEVLERYGFSDGSRMHLVMTSQGVMIVPYDQDFEDALAIYEEGATTYDDALQEMANELAE